MRRTTSLNYDWNEHLYCSASTASTQFFSKWYWFFDDVDEVYFLKKILIILIYSSQVRIWKYDIYIYFKTIFSFLFPLCSHFVCEQHSFDLFYIEFHQNIHHLHFLNSDSKVPLAEMSDSIEISANRKFIVLSHFIMWKLNPWWEVRPTILMMPFTGF